MTKHSTTNTDKSILVNQLVKEVKSSAVGYAGFLKKKQLREFLTYQIFDSNISFKKTKKRVINKKEVIRIIDETIKKCKEAIPSAACEGFFRQSI